MPNARWVVGSAGQSPQRFRPHYAIVLAVAAFVVCGAFAGSPTGAWAAPRACSVARLAQLQGDQHDLEKLIETDKRNVAQAQQIIKALPTGVLLVPSDGDHLITSAGELVSALQELARKTQVGGAKLEFLIQELRGVGAPVAGVTLDNTLVEIGTAVDVQTAQIVLKGILQQTEDKQWAIQHQFSPPTARELSLVLATMLQQTATKRIKTRKVLNSRLAIIKHEEVALKSARAAVAAEQACLAAAAKAATPAPSPVANPPASVRRAASPFSYSLVPDPPTVERNAQCAEWDPIAGTAKVTYPNGSWAYYEFTPPGAILADGTTAWTIKTTARSIEKNRLNSGIAVSGDVTFTGSTSVQALAEGANEKTESISPKLAPPAGATSITLTVGAQDCGRVTYTYR